MYSDPEILQSLYARIPWRSEISSFVSLLRILESPGFPRYSTIAREKCAFLSQISCKSVRVTTRAQFPTTLTSRDLLSLFFFFYEQREKRKDSAFRRIVLLRYQVRVFVLQQLLIVDQTNNCYPRKWCTRTFSINDLPMQSGGAIVAAFQCIGFSHGFRNRKTSPLAKSI